MSIDAGRARGSRTSNVAAASGIGAPFRAATALSSSVVIVMKSASRVISKISR